MAAAFTGRPSSATAKSDAVSRATRVPPASTNSKSRAAPDFPSPPVNSSGSEPGACPSRISAAAWSGRTMASNRARSAPRFDVRVVEGLVRDPHLLLEHEAGPALVHARDPGLVEAHPRRAQGERPRRDMRSPRAASPSSVTSGANTFCAEAGTSRVPAGIRALLVSERLDRPSGRGLPGAAGGPGRRGRRSCAPGPGSGPAAPGWSPGSPAAGTGPGARDPSATGSRSASKGAATAAASTPMSRGRVWAVTS